MTDEERRMLSDLADSVDGLIKRVDKLYASLLETPDGSPDDARPFLEEARIVIRAYQRASWATRALVWLLPAIAGVGIAVEKIRSWF